MARKVFFSFHYHPDSWRVAQIRNIGVVEGNQPVADNHWETVTRAGEAAIKRWIDGQLYGKSCAIVMIGSQTAGRKWINYEIKKAWEDGKGVLGVRIHNLKDVYGYHSTSGADPFADFVLRDGHNLSRIVKTYNPPYMTSTDVYANIKANIAGWVDEAIAIRTLLWSRA